MTERSDIQPNAKGWRRLSYTCRCGWVDWGHALPGSAQSLKLQMDREQPDWPQLAQMKVFLEGSAAYIVAYGQSMGAGPVHPSSTPTPAFWPF